MMQSNQTNRSEHPFRSYLAPVLMVVVFAALSVVAIILMEANKVPTLENDTAWFEAHFSRDSSIPLSEKQKSIIHNSVDIVSAVAEDAGVTVTLQSVCGNGYVTYYKLDVELPADRNAEQEFSLVDFDSRRLRINDDSAVFGHTGGGSQTLEDDDPSDQHVSLLLNTRRDYSPGSAYAFDNGIIRTLHLEDLSLVPEEGKIPQIKGKWDFEILFQDKGEAVELVRKPVAVRGYDLFRGTYYAAEVSSFVLTEFSAYCQYEVTSHSQSDVIGFHPVVIMKDGRTVFTSGYAGGSDTDYSWSLSVPVSLDEVAFVKLTDEVILPFHPKR